MSVNATETIAEAAKRIFVERLKRSLEHANPEAGRNVRRYTLPNNAFRKAFFSNLDGKEDT